MMPGNTGRSKPRPNLRHGWRLNLKNLDETSLALDFLYPAALGTALAFARSELQTPCISVKTLARQTGMMRGREEGHRRTGGITGRNCTCNHRDGCLRHILWSISPGKPNVVEPPGI